MNSSTSSAAAIPIIFCQTCNKVPMIARRINQPLRDSGPVEVEFECPRCGAKLNERLGAAAAEQ